MFISEIESHFEKIYHRAPGVKSEWTHPHRGPANQPLITRTLTLPGHPEKALISISGTHGPEAYIGSMIQSEILSQIDNLAHQPQRPTLIFIQNLNSFGSAWVRRGNHENIDLNRNAEGTPAVNPAFANYLSLLEARSDLEFFGGLGKLLPKLAKLGVSKVSAEICVGQSKHPKSLFYSGQTLSFELTQLKNFLFNQKFKQVMVLEIHTGLGPSGFESMLLDLPSRKDWVDLFQKQFPQNFTDTTQDQKFYPTHGALSSLTKKCFPEADLFHITQEFGTVGFLKVLKGLVLENSDWFSNQMESQKRFYRLLPLFFPNSEAWRKEVSFAGVSRFRDVMSFLTH